MAKQEFKDECDVNTIVDMYKKGAPLPVQVQPGQFIDVSELGDYKTAVEQVMEAEKVWNTVSREAREATGGDAGHDHDGQRQERICVVQVGHA